MSKPDLLSVTELAKTKIFKVTGHHLRFSNGTETHFEKIETHHPGAVMILPMLDDHTVLLIREYATAAQDYTLGFPKGAIDSVDDDILETANRELMEEAGYGANQLTWLMEMSLSPGYFDAKMQIVLAQDLYPKKLLGDEPEAIQVIPWQLSDIDALLAHPEFTESRSIAAILMLERMQRVQ